MRVRPADRGLPAWEGLTQASARSLGWGAVLGITAPRPPTSEARGTPSPHLESSQPNMFLRIVQCPLNYPGRQPLY